MRLRTLLAATAVSALTAGALSIPAYSVTPLPLAQAGTPFTWGDEDDPNGKDAIPIPGNLTAPVRSVAANLYATGVVTVDGAVRVWGKAGQAETDPELVPAGVTDATAIALTSGNGAILHNDGRVTAWGDSTALSEVPSDLRAKAVALQAGTGYAVRTNGTLATWGAVPEVPVPATVPTDLVDISATTTHVLALRSDGSVFMWGVPLPEIINAPDFGGKKVVKVATAPLYSGVVLDDGSIDVWGLVTPADEPSFDNSTPAGTVTSLGLGDGTATAVTADGAVHAWGSSDAIKAVPAALDGKPVAAVAVGTTHAAAVITTFRDVTKPTIAGQPKVGQTLTATPATFSMAPDAPATGQWYAGGAPIAGKTGSTLALDTSLVGKTVSYRTTATRGDQTVVSSSAATAPVAAAVVPKAPAQVSAKAKASGKTAKIANKVTIAVTVKTAKGIPPAGKVTVTLKGKTKKKVTVKVNAKGKATATFKKVKRGKYTATLKYTGNAKVKAATGKVKFKA